MRCDLAAPTNPAGGGLKSAANVLRIESMIKVSIDQAASRFSHWMTHVAGGEEVLVVDHEQPVARITRFEPATGARPKVGTLTSSPKRSLCGGLLRAAHR